MLWFLYTVVFKDLKKSVFSNFYAWAHKNDLRRTGIEPGSTAWEAAMLTTITPTWGWLIFHFPVTLIRQRTTLFSGQLALQINYKQILSVGS